MKSRLFLSIGALVLFAMTLPVMAQESNGSHLMKPPIKVISAPPSPAGPTGILPVQFKAAYGFNKVPNQGQGMTIALVDAFHIPTSIRPGGLPG